MNHNQHPCVSTNTQELTVLGQAALGSGALAHGAGRLRGCLLSGGGSRRMGADKALLRHPEGDTWLERTLGLLLSLQQPVSLLSQHEAHHSLATALIARREAAGHGTPPLSLIREPPPREGPLLALARLMAHHREERLLLCPVDMPSLTAACLEALIAAAQNTPATSGDGGSPTRIHLAHDGQRPQPLLAIIPATAVRQQALARTLASGERSLMRWLASEDWRPVSLPAEALRNSNRPDDLPPGVWLPEGIGPR